jgi:tetratricopeptide (TPR) repeat protein
VPELKELIESAVNARVRGDYAQAEQLLRDAVSRHPAAPEPYRYLAQTLSYRAAAADLDPVAKTRMLDEASSLLDQAEGLQKGPSPDTLHDRAWIEDERGNFPKAISLYEQAMTTVETEGRSERPVFLYNLACALAKANQPKRALEVLKQLKTQSPRALQMARQDADFQALRKDPEFDAIFGSDG